MTEAERQAIRIRIEAERRRRAASAPGGSQAAPGGAQPVVPVERGLGQVLYDNVVGDPGDGVTSWGESLGTWLNRGGETASLGLVGDEAGAAAYGMLPGRNYEGELERLRANEEGMSTAGRLSADLVGALAPGLLGAGVVSGAAGLRGAVARGVGLGGIAGATQGFMEGEGGAGERADDALWSGGLGMMLGGAVPMATAGANRVAQALMERGAIRRAARGAPSTEELRAAGRAAYQAVDDAGVQLAPDAVRGATDDIVEALTRQGLDTGPMSLTPQSARMAELLAGAVPEGAGGVPFSSLELLRRKAGVPASNLGNRVESALGSRVIEGLDDFVGNLQPGQVVAGNADDLAQNITTARDIWSRMSRSQLIEDAIENSENYLGGGSSGIRNQFARILRSPKLSRGFSDVEKRAMRRVVSGSIPEQMLQLTGSGLGQMAAAGTGAAVGGPAGAIMGAAVGGGARRASEALSRRNAEMVRALIAAGGVAEAPTVSPAARLVMDALLMGNTGRAATGLEERLPLPR